MAKGFNRPMVGNQGGMMQQIKRLQEQMEAAQAKLAEEVTTASAGGGAVKVTMTGDQHCKAVEIDPALLQDSDVDMLQDLILSAINLALEQSRQMAEQKLGPLAGNLPF
jgi:DNA-binding YbaB/EbfC family protein